MYCLTKPQLVKYLKQCRELTGYNQKQMAAHLGINHVSYSKYERGDAMPRPQALAKIMAKASEICEPPPFERAEATAAQESPDPALEGKPGEELIKRPDPLNEERTFEEQMNDLGVQVVGGNSQKSNKRLDIKWFAPKAGRSAYSDEQIKVLGAAITFGGKPYKHLLSKKSNDGDLRVKFGAIEYEGRLCLYIKPVEAGGYKLLKQESGRIKSGSPSLVKMITEAGLPKGKYKSILVKGGVVGVPEEVSQ